MVASTPSAAVSSLSATEPVPVAVLARTSTLGLQDPVASVRRQLRSCEAWLPAGWFIAAVYSDVESGATDLEARSRTESWKVLTDAGLPRDGGMADLLAAAARPDCPFAVVVCEDIERSARDTFNALKLEKELSRQGIPLFATDEPADIAGVNSTTVLVRRVKQGVAEWYRLQLKEKTWKGFEEHNAEGWNVGPAPYGYDAERHPHPSPVKASQGRTKTRLVINPAEAPVVETVFRWRTVKKLGVPTIVARLNASPGLYPVRAGVNGWTDAAVRGILANPKYTGHQVYGRRRTRNGSRNLNADPAQWLWTPQPAHQPVISMETWKAAQQAGEEHSTRRDLTAQAGAGARFYAYRGRVRCRECHRRMTGRIGRSRLYYRCPHQPANPRHAKNAPTHTRTVTAPEAVLDQITGPFFRDRVFTPRRTELLEIQLPASDAEAEARRDTQAAALKAQVRKLDAQQNAQITALEDIPEGPAAKDMRARINQRFAQLHTQRAEAEAQLRDLTSQQPRAADTSILEEIPYAGDILPDLPPGLKARLLDIFDVSILWNQPDHQATVTAVITDTTLEALPELLSAFQDGYRDTAAPAPAQTAPDLALSGGLLVRPPIAPVKRPNRAPGALQRLAPAAGDRQPPVPAEVL